MNFDPPADLTPAQREGLERMQAALEECFAKFEKPMSDEDLVQFQQMLAGEIEKIRVSFPRGTFALPGSNEAGTNTRDTRFQIPPTSQ